MPFAANMASNILGEFPEEDSISKTSSSCPKLLICFENTKYHIKIIILHIELKTDESVVSAIAAKPENFFSNQSIILAAKS